MPNVLSPRDLVFRPDNMDETVPHHIVIDILFRRMLVKFHRFCFKNGYVMHESVQ